MSTAPLQPDQIEKLHEDAFDGDRTITLEVKTIRYCSAYRATGENCVAGTKHDFRYNTLYNKYNF